MVSSFAIVEKMRAYLGGQLDLHSFREWMVGSHLEMQKEKARPEGEVPDQDAARLLSELEGRYAEFSEELVSEADWRRRVAALIAPSPQSAESYLLTLFYAAPSGSFHLNSPNISKPFQNTGNCLNSQSNYREPDVVAA